MRRANQATPPQAAANLAVEHEHFGAIPSDLLPGHLTERFGHKKIHDGCYVFMR